MQNNYKEQLPKLLDPQEQREQQRDHNLQRIASALESIVILLESKAEQSIRFNKDGSVHIYSGQKK